MRALRFLITVMFGVALVPLAAGAASAAPPSNDEASGAVALNLGDQVQQDTTQATTNAGDDALNANCGAPATEASVWYVYSPGTKTMALLDATMSDYSTGLMVFDGTPTADSLLACGPGQVGLRARAGHTYYVMAFSDTAGVNGGKLVASFSALPPAPEATLTVEPKATAYRDGSLLLRGTYSCANADGYSSDIEGTVTQTVGRTKIEGFFFVYPLECDGDVHQWEAIVTSSNGLFAGGKATSVALVFACGVFECTVTEVDQKLQVTRAGR